jgi:hypothetical protein
MQFSDQQRRRARAGTVAPPQRVAAAVREIIARDGERVAIERLQIDRATALRIASRLPCRRGSILVAARALGIDLDGGTP